MTKKIKNILVILGYILGHCSAFGTISETMQIHPNNQNSLVTTFNCDDFSDNEYSEYNSIDRTLPSVQAPALSCAPAQVPVNDDTCCYYNYENCGNIITETGYVIEESVQDVGIGIGSAIICVGDTVGGIFN